MKLVKVDLIKYTSLLVLFISLIIPLLYGIYLDSQKLIVSSIIKAIFFIFLVLRMKKVSISFYIFIILLFIYLVQGIMYLVKNPESFEHVILGILAHCINLITFLLYRPIRMQYIRKYK